MFTVLGRRTGKTQVDPFLNCFIKNIYSFAALGTKIVAYVQAMVRGQSSIINSLLPQMHSSDLVRNLVNVILPPKISTIFFQNLTHAKFIVLISMDIRLLSFFYQRSKCNICMITAHFNFFLLSYVFIFITKFLIWSTSLIVIYGKKK